MVTVAQLVESRIVIPVVVGSSPIGHPKKIKPLGAVFFRLFFALVTYIIINCQLKAFDALLQRAKKIPAVLIKTKQACKNRNQVP